MVLMPSTELKKIEYVNIDGVWVSESLLLVLGRRKRKCG